MKCPLCGSVKPIIERAYANRRFLRCQNCSLAFAWPFYEKGDAYRLFYDYEWTRSYSKITDYSLRIVSNALSKKLGMAKRLSGLREIRNMLDIGCGSGIYMEAARFLGLKTVGTDVDSYNVNLAMSRGLDVRLGFLEDMDFGDELFDFIHIKDVLHLCPDPMVLLRKACSYLQTNGVIYVDVNNQNGLFAMLRRKFAPTQERYGQLEPPLRCLAFSRRSFAYLIRKCGLRTKKVFAYSYGHPVYYPVLEDETGKSRDRIYRRGKVHAAERYILRLVDCLGLGGFLAAYCQKIQ